MTEDNIKKTTDRDGHPAVGRETKRVSSPASRPGGERKFGHSGTKPGGRPSYRDKRHEAKPKVKGGVFDIMGTRDEASSLKKSGDDAVYFVGLGGLEEIGRNMSFFEYKDEIIAVDAGVQFAEEETPGIDFIIPNISYLEAHKQNVKALIITHAHLDHIGAIPYLIEKMGNPPIYTTPLAKELIKKRQAEFINSPQLDIRIVKQGDVIRLSPNFEADFFDVSHSIPDTTGFILKTPVGNMVTFGDFRVEYDDEGNPTSLNELKYIREKKIHTLLLDSTNSENPGKSLSEKTVEKNLEEIFKKAEGRIIVSAFATMISRIAAMIKIAEKLDRKVVFSGRSIKENTEIAKNLGYIKIKPGTVISPEEVSKYKDDKIFILSTGAQGESNASLMKIVTGEHRSLRIKAGDSVIFSSSVIPGNERSVQILKDNLVRQGAIVYHNKLVDIHATGHAPQDELKMVMKAVAPRFFIPLHGHVFHRNTNARNAVDSGILKENIVIPDNGERVRMTENSVAISGESVPSSYVMVDGLGVGDVGEVVLRDRRLLSQEGMIVIIATVSRRDVRMLKNPDIISRGFIYLKENQKILDDIRMKTRSIVSRLPNDQELDADYLKTLIRDQIGQYVFSKTNRRPMVLPVIIEI